MRFAGTQTIYRCNEHEIVNIPFSALLDASGKLDLYPEIASKGYFDINFRQGQLSLRAKGFVGLIPISDTIAIHVQPKTPIANLIAMIWRAGVRLDGLTGFIRGYQDCPGEIVDPEELYVLTFISAMRGLRQSGPLKRYRTEQSDMLRRGRLLIPQTVARRAHGTIHRPMFEFYDLTVDNLENQIIKHTAARLLGRFSRDASGPNQSIAIDLRLLLSMLSNVDSSRINDAVVARKAVSLIRGLPSTHRFYEPAMWLAYLLATKSGVLMERIGRARFESVIIDAADVFEKYVRTLLEEAVTSHFRPCRVFDGNRTAIPLFATTKQFLSEPDYYIKTKAEYLAVADGKYKPKIDTDDRYAMLAYCEALNVKKSAFICPQFQGTDPVTHQGTTRGGVEVRIVRINLAAIDLAAEESDFKARIAESLGIAKPRAPKDDSLS